MQYFPIAVCIFYHKAAVNITIFKQIKIISCVSTSKTAKMTKVVKVVKKIK